MSKPRWVEELAIKRIKKLFQQAEEEFPTHPERSNRYMELAHKISERYNTPLPSRLKRRICPECYSYWVPGETVKIRADSDNQRILYTCQRCRATRSYGYSGEKQKKN